MIKLIASLLYKMENPSLILWSWWWRRTPEKFQMAVEKEVVALILEPYRNQR